ncbi:hypothetical protein PR048_033699 [Dryococelus australis]|uniref:Uncharacterized protein n=1 Tax=Dryococelus australis TaxID=614101 RepID=A0ABQ9G113_9NEOP|nr:hypothetical protein PR048_033699 [Dryococelus australis]
MLDFDTIYAPSSKGVFIFDRATQNSITSARLLRDSRADCKHISSKCSVYIGRGEGKRRYSELRECACVVVIVASMYNKRVLLLLLLQACTVSAGAGGRLQMWPAVMAAQGDIVKPKRISSNHAPDVASTAGPSASAAAQACKPTAARAEQQCRYSVSVVHIEDPVLARHDRYRDVTRRTLPQYYQDWVLERERLAHSMVGIARTCALPTDR